MATERDDATELPLSDTHVMTQQMQWRGQRESHGEPTGLSESHAVHPSPDAGWDKAGPKTGDL